MSHQEKMVTAVFRNRLEAEQAFDYLRTLGYEDSDINVLMSDKSHSTFSPLRENPEIRHQAGSAAVEGVGVGGAIGTVIGATAAGLAAIGTSLVIPGLGLLVAGPIAAALAGAGAGAVAGGALGALIGLGITEPNARAYEAALRDGGVVVGVRPRTSEDANLIEEKFEELHGENVCYC
jgi:hypothetical protein